MEENSLNHDAIKKSNVQYYVEITQKLTYR